MSNVARKSKPPIEYSELEYVIDAGSNPGEAVEWLDSECRISLVEIDNTTGSELVFLKMYNTSSAPTLGGTAPVMCVPCPAGSSVAYVVSAELLSGGTDGPHFDTGLWYTISTKGGTAGTASDIPSVAPTVRMFANRY